MRVSHFALPASIGALALPLLLAGSALAAPALQEPEKPPTPPEEKQEPDKKKEEGAQEGKEEKKEGEKAKEGEKPEEESSKKHAKGEDKDKEKKKEKRVWTFEPPPGPTILIRAQRVIVRPGEELEGAQVLIQGGRISAVGKDLRAPEGARVIEGQVVCAGFLDPWSSLGIDDESVADGNASPDARSTDALDPYSEAHLLADALRSGVTSVRVQAGAQAPLGGLGAVVHTGKALAGKSGVVLGDACVSAAIGVQVGVNDVFDRIGQIDRLVSALEGGRRYREAQVEYRHDLEEWEKKIAEEQKKLEKDFKKAQKDREKAKTEAEEKDKEFKEKAYKEDKKPSPPKYSPEDEVMARVADGEIPLVVEAHRAEELRALLAETAKFDRLRLVFAGATQARELAREIAERGVPVIVQPVPLGASRPPYLEDHDLALAADLHAAGVEVLIGSGGPASFSRDLPLLAGLAIGHGLEREAAFEALTIGAAEALDVARSLGTVESGKQADLLVLDGAPLAPATHVRYALQNGEIAVEP